MYFEGKRCIHTRTRRWWRWRWSCFAWIQRLPLAHSCRPHARQQLLLLVTSWCSCTGISNTMAPGEALACLPCLTDLVYGLVWFPLLLTALHFGVLLRKGYCAVQCCHGVQTHVSWKGCTNCVHRSWRNVLPLLFLAYQAQPWVQVLVLQSGFAIFRRKGNSPLYPWKEVWGNCSPSTASQPRGEFPPVSWKGETRALICAWLHGSRVLTLVFLVIVVLI